MPVRYVKFILLCCIGIHSILSAQNIIVKPYLQLLDTTSVTIMFETDVATTATITFGNTPFLLNNNVNTTAQVGSGSTQIFTGTITPLLPKTKYYYKVVLANNNQSLVYHFTTMSGHHEDPIHLVAVSDMQMQPSRPLIFQNIIGNGIIPIAEEKIEGGLDNLHGVIIPGDLVQNGGNYNEWKNTFFNKTESLSPYVPLYPALGNHEYYNNGLGNYLKYFSLPLNGDPSYPEQWWYKDFSNIRVVALNSSAAAAQLTQQLTWLSSISQTACQNDNIDFLFVQLHHPFKSELWTPGELGFTGEVIQILENFTAECNKPSAHFYGHTHGYSRGQSRHHNHLWVNVATAGGAIDYWGQFPNQDYSEFNISEDDYGFVLIKSEAGPDPQFSIYRYSFGDDQNSLVNQIIDSITIKKNEYAPVKPKAIFPFGQNIPPSCVNLKASQFVDPQSFHQASQWQVSLSADFTDPVADIWKQHQNKYFNEDLQAGDDLTDEQLNNLNASTTYFWRVRYRDKYLKWSQWSDTLSFSTAAQQSTPNLLVNAGAETGISNWTGQIESLTNNECGSVPPYQGIRFFAVGGVCTGESSTGTAFQRINVSSYAQQIDGGNFYARFSGYLRAYATNNDLPEIAIECLDAAGNILLSTPYYGSGIAQWQKVEQSVLIPVLTRTIKILLKGTRLAGTDNDSYFDELSLTLFTPLPCLSCYGHSGIDTDQDQFCSDIDCNDNNNAVYPGASETCDNIDNNCDGLADLGSTVTGTGNGNNQNWEDSLNWNQLFPPLNCQHVIIGQNKTVYLDGYALSKSLELGSNSDLNIQENAEMVLDARQENIQSIMQISGQLNNSGRLDIQNGTQKGIRVIGSVINSGRMYIKNVTQEAILLENGSLMENSGYIKTTN